MKRFLLSLAVIIPSFFLLSPAFCKPISSSSQPAVDTVSMPWGNFMSLREQAKDDEAKRIFAYSYEKAIYEGNAVIDKEDYRLHFKAVIDVSTFKDGDTLVPFLANSLNLESLSVNQQQSTWIEKDGFFQVYISTKGQYTIKAEFTIIINSKTWPRSIYLPLVKIAQSEIKITVPDENVEAEFDTGVARETAAGTKGSIIKGFVPAASGVNIRWLQKNEEKREVPLKMGATVFTYLSLEENGASGQNEISFHILQGETNFFSILVPSSVDILEVTPAHSDSLISQWFTEEEEGDRLIHIYSSYQQSKEFKVQLIYERTETRANYTFTLPRLIPQSVERYENLIAVGSKANVEISEGEAALVERRDVRFLPQEIRKMSESHGLFYYKALDEAFTLSFSVQSHEKAETIPTRVEAIEADSVLTESGTVMTKITYSLKNNQAQFLRILLPEHSKLLSAFLKGQEIQPALDGDHVEEDRLGNKPLLIPIEKSVDNSFPVEIAYLTRMDSFKALGLRSVVLPKIELSVGELFWRIYLPDTYQILYFGGNIERKKFSLSTRIRWLLGEAVPETEHNAYAGMKQSYDYSEKGLRRRFKKSEMALREQTMDESMPGNQIQVQIPVAGNKFSFGSYLIEGFTPRISFFYVTEKIHNGLGMVMSGLFFLFIFWSLAIILERKSLPLPLQKSRSYFLGLAVFAFMILLMILFSFGMTILLSKSTIMALLCFALWQNRQIAKRFHAKMSGWAYYLPEAVLAGLLFILLMAFIIQIWPFIAFICFVSIGFHALWPLWEKGAFFFTRKKKSETVALLCIGLGVSLWMSRFIMPPALWAERPQANNYPELTDTQVTVSWDVVEKMLKKIEAKRQSQEKKIKEDYIFGNVNITGKISEKYAMLHLNVPLSILAEEYIKIPLLPSSIAITEALYKEKPLTLNEQNGTIFFEAKKENSSPGTLEIDVMIPVKEKGGVHEFAIETPLIRGGLIDLGFGEEIKSILLHGVAWQEREGQQIRAALGKSRQLRGELATFERKKETADEDSKRVKKMYSATYTLLSIEEEVVSFFSSIRYQILNDQVRSFEIRLPEDVIVHEIVGEDLEGWDVKETVEGVTTYTVKVLYPVAGKYDLSIQYEKSMPADDTEFRVPALDVVGVARDVGYVGIEMQAQAEISLETLSKAHLIDIQELPQIIKADAYSPFVYAIRYMERPYEIAFKIVKHKNLQMDAAIADRIQYTFVISPQGKIISQIQMWVRNSQKQFASIVLPNGAKVLSTFLDNRSIKPSLGNSKEILLPLKRQSLAPFLLEIVYEGTEISLHGTGSLVHIQFPQIDLPASIVAADIYIPEDYYFSEPAGDFQQATVAGFVSWRQDRQIFNINAYLDSTGDNNYTMESNDQEQASNMPPPVSQIPPPPVSQFRPPPVPQMPAFPQEMQGHQSAFTQGGFQLINRGGMLPLKITLPKKGKKISLNTFYIPEKKVLKANFFASHQGMQYLGYALSLILFICLGFFIPYSKYLSNTVRMASAVGILILFYFMPFTWQSILIYAILGFCIHYLWQWIKKKPLFGK